MIHQPLGGSQGQATDIEIYTKEILTLRGKLNEILARHTGQPLEKIEKDTDRNFFMSAEEAREYGLIDEVIDEAEVRRDQVDKRGPMKKRIASPHPIRCSFCGRGQDEVARLVSGPSVYICSECVKLCNDILEGEIDREEPLAKGNLPKPAEIKCSSTST